MMTPRQKRFLLILLIVAGVSSAIGLILYALKQNINLYYTPTQLAEVGYPSERTIRMGGIVETGSVHFAAEGLQMSFVLTDFTHQTKVEYTGVLPTLFREGQGVVIEGKLNTQGTFIANQVLAKHDANYMPPGMKNKMLGKL